MNSPINLYFFKTDGADAYGYGDFRRIGSFGISGWAWLKGDSFMVSTANINTMKIKNIGRVTYANGDSVRPGGWVPGLRILR